MNLCWEGHDWRIRDLHLFDEKYAERYLTDRVTTNYCTYDTLPVLDGFNWSTPGNKPAGMRVVSLAPDGTTRSIDFGEPTVTELGKDSLLVTMSITSGGELKILVEPSTVHVDMTGDGAPKSWAIELAWDAGKATSIADLEEHAIRYRHNGFDYALRCGNAVVTKGSDTQSLLIRAQGPNVMLTF